VDFNEGIDTALKKLRYALGDSAQNPTFIVTIPRRGYRFIAPVANGRSDVLAEFGSEPQLPSAAVTPPVSRTSKHYLALLIVFALIFTIGYVFLRRALLPRDLELRRAQMTKLTDNGEVQGVAISRDGRYVAFARGDEIRQSLWLRDIAARSDLQILPEGPGFHGLTFSPGGNSLYVLRSDVKDPSFKYLYVLPSHGGTLTKLITDVDSPVSFSPDGKQFVYEHCVPPRNYIELRIANADGSNDNVLTLIRDGSAMLYQPGPNWSPDGRNIAVPVVLANGPQRWVLDIVSATDGSIREMYSSSGNHFLGRPVWFPSGKGLLFTHVDNSGGRYQLWTISFPEGRAQPLTHDVTNYGSDLDMTRDGRTFASTTSNVVSHPWVAPASDLSQAHQVTNDGLPVRGIAEAPDGKLLVTSTENVASLMHTDGSQRTRFTDVEPVFEPASCGRFVLFRVDHEDSAVVRFGLDGLNPTVLVRGDIDSPTCSADQSAVFYYTWNPPQKLWKIPLQGGPPQYVADSLGDLLCKTIDISPDGRYLVYPYTQFGRVPSEGWRLAVIPVNGGPPVRQFAVPSEADGVQVRWSASGKGLQYVVTQNGVSNLWEQPLSGGKPKQLTRFTSSQIFDFNWTRDHTRLLMSRGTESHDAILLTDLAIYER
jgi:Tol biopolymer transport system component